MKPPPRLVSGHGRTPAQESCFAVGVNRRSDRPRRRRSLVGETTTYFVTLRRPDAPDRSGVIETRLPCNVGDVLPGILREENGKLLPFTGRVLEHATGDPPYAAMLLIGSEDLSLSPPFGSDDDLPLSPPFGP
jgi:hypothetical protein